MLFILLFLNGSVAAIARGSRLTVTVCDVLFFLALIV
jgi:hypothetical protein